MDEIRDYFESEDSENDVQMASENNIEENQGGNNQEDNENNNNEIELEEEENSYHNSQFVYNENEFQKGNILNFLLTL